MSTDDRNVRFTTEVGLILDDVELEIELAYLSYAIRMGRTELHYVPERLEVAPLDADVAKALASAGYEPRVGGELDDGTPTLDIDLRRRPPAVRLQAAVPRWVVLGADAAPLPESTQPFNINWSGSVLDVRSPAMIEIDGEPLCQALICCAVDMDIRDYGIKDVWFNPTECRLRQPLSAEHVARIERSGAVVRGNGREVDLTGALGVSCRIASSEHAFSLAVQTLHFRSVRRGRAEHPVVSRSSAIQSGAALERVEIQFAEPPAALASRSAEKLVDAFETTPDPNLAAALAIELGAGPATSTPCCAPRWPT